MAPLTRQVLQEELQSFAAEKLREEFSTLSEQLRDLLYKPTLKDAFREVLDEREQSVPKMGIATVGVGKVGCLQRPNASPHLRPPPEVRSPLMIVDTKEDGNGGSVSPSPSTHRWMKPYSVGDKRSVSPSPSASPQPQAPSQQPHSVVPSRPSLTVKPVFDDPGASLLICDEVAVTDVQNDEMDGSPALLPVARQRSADGDRSQKPHETTPTVPIGKGRRASNASVLSLFTSERSASSRKDRTQEDPWQRGKNLAQRIKGEKCVALVPSAPQAWSQQTLPNQEQGWEPQSGTVPLKGVTWSASAIPKTLDAELNDDADGGLFRSESALFGIAGANPKIPSMPNKSGLEFKKASNMERGGTVRSATSTAVMKSASRSGVLMRDENECDNTPSSEPSTPILQRIVEGAAFDFFSATLILANAGTIGVQTDYMATHSLSDVPMTFTIIDKVFLTLFTAELALRIIHFRLYFFYMPGWRWSVFDTLVIGLQILEEVISMIANFTDSVDGGGAGGNTGGVMRVMRILRLVRILRVLRILRFLTELRTIVISIIGSMRSLFWTLVLLLLGIFLCGVYFTQIVLDYRLAVDNAGDDSEEYGNLKKYYGSLGRSILSLYQAMSGGLDWDDMCGPLIDQISPAQGVVFSLYIAFTVLALMNVVTGVFVEGALKSAKQEETEYMAINLRDMFHDADVDDTGVLSAINFQAQFSKPEMQDYLKTIDVDPDEATALFYLLDLDESGQIDYEEFVHGCLRLRGAAKAIDIITVLHENRKDHKEHTAALVAVTEQITWIMSHLWTMADGGAKDGTFSMGSNAQSSAIRVDTLSDAAATEEEFDDMERVTLDRDQGRYSPADEDRTHAACFPGSSASDIWSADDL